MNIQDYIKPEYTFREIIDLQKLPLEVKEKITVEVLKQAFEKKQSQNCDSIQRRKGQRGRQRYH